MEREPWRRQEILGGLRQKIQVACVTFRIIDLGFQQFG